MFKTVNPYLHDFPGIIHADRYWHLGKSYANKNRDIIYVNIPKNASSWTRAKMSSLGWDNINYLRDRLAPNHKIIVVLRKPIDRWLSGIAEYFYRKHNNMYELIKDSAEAKEVLCQLVFHQIVFDEHTESQTFYLTGLPRENMIFFNATPDYSVLFSKYLRNELRIDNDFDSLGTINALLTDMPRLRWYFLFKLSMEKNIEYYNHLRVHFGDDLTLYNEANFYHG